MENPDQMDKFLDASDQTKLIQEDINHLNWSITSSEIEPVTVSQLREVQDPYVFTAEFYQNLKEELIPTLLKHFHEIEREHY
jgi:hypothetical protein